MLSSRCAAYDVRSFVDRGTPAKELTDVAWFKSGDIGEGDLVMMGAILILVKRTMIRGLFELNRVSRGAIDVKVLGRILLG